MDRRCQAADVALLGKISSRMGTPLPRIENPNNYHLIQRVLELKPDFTTLGWLMQSHKKLEALAHAILWNCTCSQVHGLQVS